MQVEQGLALVLLQQFVVHILLFPALQHLRLPLGQARPHGKVGLRQIDGLVVIHISRSYKISFLCHAFQKFTISFRHFRQLHATGRPVSSFGRRTSSAPSKKPPLKSALPPDCLDVQMHGIPHISHPCSIGAPQPGHSISIPPRKNKNALSPSRDKAFGKTLCGTTLGCRGLADTTAHHPLSRADAVTGIMRPLLLASSFGGKLQGDFHAPHPSALHQTAALFAGTGGLLVLIYAKMFNY